MSEALGCFVLADCFHLNDEKAWKSLAKLTSEYPLVAKALSGTSFSFRYTCRGEFGLFKDAAKTEKKHITIQCQSYTVNLRIPPLASLIINIQDHFSHKLRS